MPLLTIAGWIIILIAWSASLFLNQPITFSLACMLFLYVSPGRGNGGAAKRREGRLVFIGLLLLMLGSYFVFSRFIDEKLWLRSIILLSAPLFVWGFVSDCRQIVNRKRTERQLAAHQSQS